MTNRYFPYKGQLIHKDTVYAIFPNESENTFTLVFFDNGKVLYDNEYKTMISAKCALARLYRKYVK